MADERGPDGRFLTQPEGANTYETGNQAALGPAFGAEGALKRIQKGEPFIGLALQVLHETLVEMGVDLQKLTPLGRIKVRVIAETEADRRLFGMAALGASEDGRHEDWERYVQRRGWLAGKVLSAIRDLEQDLADNRTLDYSELIKDLTNDES